MSIICTNKTCTENGVAKAELEGYDGPVSCGACGDLCQYKKEVSDDANAAN